MPNLPISQLPQSTALQGDELFVDVQGGITKYTTLDSISAYATSSIQTEVNSLTAATSSYLTAHQDTGSLMVTGSLSGSSLVFEKGDTTTFDIDLSSTFITPSQTGSFVESAYISLYSSASQPLAVSGAAQPVTFTSVWANNGITLESGSRLVMAEPGVYNFSFVAQVGNSDNAVHDSWFWIKYNGNNFPNSTTQMTLQPRKSSGEPSAQLMTVDIVGVNQVPNGYIELYWTGDQATVTSLTETPATSIIPETPSVIANIVRVG